MVFTAISVVAGLVLTLPLVFDSSSYQEATQASLSAPTSAKELFTQRCAECHTLKAAGAQGVGGPNLDTLASKGALTKESIVMVIENGHGEMPAITQEPDATTLADYVLSVAGKN